MRQCLIFLSLLMGEATVLALPTQEPSPDSKGRLVKIEMKGLDRYARDQIIVESGLREGEVYSLKDIDTAAQRLRDSGLFSKVEFDALAEEGQMRAEFSLIEVQWGVPVIFENFIWFSDEEIVAALAQRIPSFDGTAPSSSRVVERIQEALQQFLSGKGIPGQVEYLPAMALNLGGPFKEGTGQKHLYRIQGLDLRICSLLFPQLAAIPEKQIKRLAKPLIGSTYSRQTLNEFLQKRLLPLYLESGYLQVAFAKPAATQVTSGSCQGQLSVEIPVEEGSQYRMGQVFFSGLPEKEARKLPKKWKLKSGNIFKASALNDFINKKIPAELRAGLRLRIDPDDQAQVVDVRFDFHPTAK